MLSTVGFEVLYALLDRSDATASDLADETAHSREHVYRVLDRFLEDDLVAEVRGNYNQRRVRLRETPVTEAYRELVASHGHVAWPELLSPATLRVCWYLDEPRRVTTIAERLGISRQAVHRALSPLKGRAMLSPDGPEYALAEEMEPLLAFARAVVEHDQRKRARRLAPSATVEWCDPKRALVRAQRPEDSEALGADDDWQLTGLAGFREYGLAFNLAGEPAFWYDSVGDRSAADLVCHTLVLGADSRRTSYAMLLIEAAGIDLDALVETAAWYDFESTVGSLYEATRGESDRDADVALPGESAYEELRSQYGVE